MLLCGSLVVLAPVLIGVAACSGDNGTRTAERYQAQIDGATADLEVAVTGRQRRQGLRSRMSLDDNEGMLFVLPATVPGLYVLNRNRFDLPLDTAFVDSNGKIIKIRTIKTDEDRVVDSGGPVQFMVQMPGGWFAGNEIEKEAHLNIPKRFVRAAEWNGERLRRTEINVGGRKAVVEVADDSGEHRRGLMFRRFLREDHGMLFVYEEPAERSFFMKNTYVPLDLAYIRSDGTILEIHQMTPLDESDVTSSEPVPYALEMPRGWFEENGVGPGDHVELNNIETD